MNSSPKGSHSSWIGNGGSCTDFYQKFPQYLDDTILSLCTPSSLSVPISLCPFKTIFILGQSLMLWCFPSSLMFPLMPQLHLLARFRSSCYWHSLLVLLLLLHFFVWCGPLQLPGPGQQLRKDSSCHPRIVKIEARKEGCGSRGRKGESASQQQWKFSRHCLV